MEIEHEDFIKGLRLLHSRSPDSSDELKKLLDFYHVKKLNCNQESRRSKESIMNAFSSLQSLNQGIRGEEKKTKIFEDDSEATDIEDNEVLDSNEISNNVKNFCVICKQNVNSNNRILECQECKLCYHPDCHKPPVPKKDINDPRSIWYCFKCKNIGKKLNKSTISSGKIIINKNTSGSNNSSINSLSSSLNVNYNQNVSKDQISLNKMANSTKTLETTELKSTMGPLKRPNKITSSSQSYVIMKPSTISVTSSRQTTTAVNAVTQNKSKTSNIGSLHSGYGSSNSISNLDKRLANIKKSKSNSKFS